MEEILETIVKNLDALILSTDFSNLHNACRIWSAVPSCPWAQASCSQEARLTTTYTVERRALLRCCLCLMLSWGSLGAKLAVSPGSGPYSLWAPTSWAQTWPSPGWWGGAHSETWGTLGATVLWYVQGWVKSWLYNCDFEHIISTLCTSISSLGKWGK